MNHADALNFIIDDGIMAAIMDYCRPSQKDKLSKKSATPFTIIGMACLNSLARFV